MKTWEILTSLTIQELEKIERHTSVLSITADIEGNGIDFSNVIAGELDSDQRPSKRDLIARITIQVYAVVNREGDLWLDGAANFIVPALAGKPYGMCSVAGHR